MGGTPGKEMGLEWLGKDGVLRKCWLFTYFQSLANPSRKRSSSQEFGSREEAGMLSREISPGLGEERTWET